MRGIAIAVVLAGCCWGIPLLAHACSTCDLGEYLELPGAQDERPANALILANTEDVSSLAAVAIDGEPATLVPAGVDWPYDRTTWRIDPLPAAGAMVDFGGYSPPICFGEDPPEPWQYVAGPADLDPPSAPTALVLDVHAYGYYDTSGCIDPPDATYWIHGELGEQEYVRIELVANGTRLQLVHHQPAIGRFTIELRAALGDVDPLEVCVHVSTMDIAGNESDVVVLCEPCHVRDDRDAADPYTSAPDQPDWNHQDVHPGGVCVPTMPPPGDGSTGDGTDDSGSESGPEPGSTTSSTTDHATDDTASQRESGILDRGCACREARASALPVMVLLAIRRRRRSKRAAW